MHSDICQTFKQEHTRCECLSFCHLVGCHEAQEKRGIPYLENVVFRHGTHYPIIIGVPWKVRNFSCVPPMNKQEFWRTVCAIFSSLCRMLSWLLHPYVPQDFNMDLCDCWLVRPHNVSVWCLSLLDIESLSRYTLNCKTCMVFANSLAQFRSCSDPRWSHDDLPHKKQE